MCKWKQQPLSFDIVNQKKHNIEKPETENQFELHDKFVYSDGIDLIFVLLRIDFHLKICWFQEF